MPAVGDEAPEFTLPAAFGDSYDDVGTVQLSGVDAETVVLAFFPAAFTGGCKTELRTFRDSIAQFNDCDTAVLGISADLPPALNVFSLEHDLNFPLLSDAERTAIEAYDVVREDLYGTTGARRSIFVVRDGTVSYRWVRDPDEQVDYADLVRSVQQVVTDAA